MRSFLRTLLAIIAPFILSQTASAADMPLKEPYVAPTPAYNWTGFYAGLNLGGSWGWHGVDNLDGIIGGGQIGFNWQADQWVFGVEGDFQGSGQKAHGSFFNPVIPATADFNNKLSWFGTLRVRGGYAFDCWLPYVTAGLAYGHSEVGGTSSVGTPSVSAVQNYKGWTVGGGIEWAFLDRWSVKAEYLYIDFGTGPTVVVDGVGNLNLVNAKLIDNVARVGANYRF